MSKMSKKNNNINNKVIEPQFKKGNYMLAIADENGKVIKKILALGSEIFVETIANAEGLVVDF